MTIGKLSRSLWSYIRTSRTIESARINTLQHAEAKDAHQKQKIVSFNLHYA